MILLFRNSQASSQDGRIHPFASFIQSVFHSASRTVFRKNVSFPCLKNSMILLFTGPILSFFTRRTRFLWFGSAPSPSIPIPPQQTPGTHYLECSEDLMTFHTSRCLLICWTLCLDCCVSLGSLRNNFRIKLARILSRETTCVGGIGEGD